MGSTLILLQYFMVAKLIFFGFFFTVHFLVNFYIYRRGVAALHNRLVLKHWFRGVMLLLFLAYPLGRWLDSVYYSTLSVVLHWLGSFWFAAMLYLFMALFVIDLIRLLNFVGRFLPDKNSDRYVQLKQRAFVFVAISVVAIVLLGHINAWYPVINRQTIEIGKSAGHYSELKVVAVSDIHLGTIIGPRKTKKLVEAVNALDADIILLVGDVIDEDIKPVIEQNLGESLAMLKAPLGVWAVPGNHEYIGGVNAAITYLSDHGIHILRDSVAFVDSSFYLVGRDDRDGRRFAGVSRKEIGELVQGVDQAFPLIAMNHQPHEFDQAQQAGVDLHLSGHTHYGQLWPLGYLTDRLFEIGRGYLQKGNTHFFVSTGFGTWGPPVRTGSRPEILEIRLLFK